MSPVGKLNVIMEARRELGLWYDTELARFLGVSTRTIRRHHSGFGMVTGDAHDRIIRALYPTNPELAERVAGSIGKSCAAMGLGPTTNAAQAPTTASGKPAATQVHATLLVCAAADALSLVPRDVRPALATIFGAARELGVDMDSLANLLTEGAKAKKG